MGNCTWHVGWPASHVLDEKPNCTRHIRSQMGDLVAWVGNRHAALGSQVEKQDLPHKAASDVLEIEFTVVVIHGHHPTQYPEDPKNTKNLRSMPGKPEEAEKPKIYASDLCPENPKNPKKRSDFGF